MIAFTTNLEHVGDIIDKNLMELAGKKMRTHGCFSREGLQDLKEIHAHLMETVRLALTVFIHQELDSARALLARKDQLRAMELNSTERHLARLRSGQVASIETSALHLDIVRDFKRINSHLTSVAYPILDRAGSSGRAACRASPKRATIDPRRRRTLPSRRPSRPWVQRADVLRTGWAAGFRTCECRDQNPVPYRLATPKIAPEHRKKGRLLTRFFLVGGARRPDCPVTARKRAPPSRR